MKFYKCEHCGNIITYFKKSEVDVICCGQKVTEIIANSEDASSEKHVPIVKVEGNIVKVNVGSNPHPMTQEHHISWVVVETSNGFLKKDIKDNAEGKAIFYLSDNEFVVNVYAYCNLHGLWKN